MPRLGASTLHVILPYICEKTNLIENVICPRHPPVPEVLCCNTDASYFATLLRWEREKIVMAILNTFLFKYISIFGSFGVRSRSVRDPFGVRSGSVRANFGPKFSEPKVSKFQKKSVCGASPPRRGPSRQRG